jgi:starch phosphorylase
LDIVPHTYIFAAKAFPSYLIAKSVIKLINTVAQQVNSDKTVNDRLKVVFLPNYSVSLAEIMIPAGDVSEQISTASKEASGTGNMKFMMNGAVTCATLDGANVEIRQEVGDDNIVLFGMTADEVIALQKAGTYRSEDLIYGNPSIARLLDDLHRGYKGLCRPDEFELIIRHLVNENDPCFTLADFESYKEAQHRIDVLYRDRESWNRMSAMNIAGSGVFSSDNTIKRYAKEIWNVKYD